MRYRKSDELKESGIEWISEVPQEWNLIKLKRIGNFSSGTGFPNKYQGKEDGKYPFYKVSDMNIDGNEVLLKSCNNWISEDVRSEIGAKVFPEKTIVFPKIGAALLTNKRRVLSRDSIVDNNVMAFSVRRGDYKYWYYWLLGLDMARIANPSTVPTINESELKELTVSFPTLPEQRSIAAFLDRKTKAIDGLIQKKAQLIERLKEKRQALITQAVTKGLDPDVPRKDSGLKWLGKIPASWETVNLKWVSSIEYGIGGEIDSELKEGIRLLSLPNVKKDGRLDLKEEFWVEPEKVEEQKYILEKGDLLFNWRNGSSDHLGKTVLFQEDEKFSHVSFLLRIRPHRSVLVPKYLHLLLNNYRTSGFFTSSKAGVNNTFNLTELKNLPVIIPSIEEQKRIVNKIKSISELTFEVVDELKTEIEKLKEYRQSLISAAVTGKIDVRDEVEVESKEMMA